MIVNWAYDSHGSAQDLFHYGRVARSLGHEVALYGMPDPNSVFNYSLDIGSADAIIFIFEFTTRLAHAERTGFARMIDRVPRSRRIVIDCDGKYNDAINLLGDVNHTDEESSRAWVEICDSLSDKIYQPTYQPQRPNVRTFFFHAYNPDWEAPLDFSVKPYGMYYVGNNWFRWCRMKRVLEALEPIRGRIGRIGITGNGWDSVISKDCPGTNQEAYHTDPAYLQRLEVELNPPVRFDQVIGEMSKGVFSPVLLRPLFDHLHLVTCRTFETPAANTIPLFAQDPAYVEWIYGEQALELALPEDGPQDRILDILERPDHYATIVKGIRRHLAEKYSYSVQFQELLEIIRS
jgi:hypothetical protein